MLEGRLRATKADPSIGHTGVATTAASGVEMPDQALAAIAAEWLQKPRATTNSIFWANSAVGQKARRADQGYQHATSLPPPLPTQD